MAVPESKQNCVAGTIPALFWVALGTAIVASGLAQAAVSSSDAPAPVNRTVETLQGFQDLQPPSANGRP